MMDNPVDNVVNIGTQYRVNPAVKTDMTTQEKSVQRTYTAGNGEYHVREINYSVTWYEANGKAYTYSTSQVFDRTV